MGGRDKAFAAVGGEAIAVRTVRLLRALFPQVVVATNRPDRFGALDVETVRDVVADRGPLAGVHAAMQVARHPHVFVVACDMPGLDPDVIRFLVDRRAEGDAVVPCWEGDVEPLHAVYATRCLAAVEATLRSPAYAMRDLLARLDVRFVREDELRGIGGAARSLLNVNTPEELAAAGGRFEDGDP
jgi:molybdopterin-guanine dinucleotide biosynthesis protein A